MVFGKDDAVNENQPDNLPVNENNGVVTNEEPQVEPGDTPAPDSDIEVGSDVGMEFPVPGDDEVDEMIVEEGDVISDPIPPAETNSVEFTVDAFSFGYSMEEIRVKEGDMVVDEFNAATDKISEGGTASVTFVANKKGSFEYYCSVGNHRAQGMVGTLIVE